ncbi:flavin monoamine oxidase family protein [Candidatus Paracaedibacter symbiosus]|uniref:flavin monoamine oxidase family protein n=1 Tax=Candidatus Paracaedibacter symbiosus TaxID=244582 RepID=UPI000509CDD2|nr:NAD(P)/FAD-dependent oxidoreductase [Candidatus Paracaedibacter symbiosus]
MAVGSNQASRLEAESSSSAKPIIAIVGAGLAGLTTAYYLRKKGYEVDVFEARNRVGGRVQSVFIENLDGTESIAELGGQNITDGGGATHFLNLAKELDLQTVEDHLQFSRIFYDGKNFHDPHELLKQFPFTRKSISKKLETLQKTATSIQDILDEIFEEHAVLKQIIEVQLTAYEGSTPHKLSVYHNIETLKYSILGGISAAQQMMGYKPLLHRMSLKEGNATLPEKLAQAVQRVHFNKVLKQVQLTEDNHLLLVFHDQTKVICDKLVLAIPGSTYGDISFAERALPASRLQLIQQVQYGTNAKILMSTKDKNPSYNTVLTPKMVAFLNADQKVLNMYFSGENGAHLAHTQQELFEEGVQAIRLSFQGVKVGYGQPVAARDTQFEHYQTPVLKSWFMDPYAKGSYSNFGLSLGGKLAETTVHQGISVKSIFAPIEDRVYFVGEHATILKEIGTMEAAVESGARITQLF